LASLQKVRDSAKVDQINVRLVGYLLNKLTCHTQYVATTIRCAPDPNSEGSAFVRKPALAKESLADVCSQ
jgi:hypothetical protein